MRPQDAVVIHPPPIITVHSELPVLVPFQVKRIYQIDRLGLASGNISQMEYLCLVQCEYSFLPETNNIGLSIRLRIRPTLVH